MRRRARSAVGRRPRSPGVGISVAGSTSTSTGRQPGVHDRVDRAAERHRRGQHREPGGSRSARSASSSAAVQEETATACRGVRPAPRTRSRTRRPPDRWSASLSRAPGTLHRSHRSSRRSWRTGSAPLHAARSFSCPLGARPLHEPDLPVATLERSQNPEARGSGRCMRRSTSNARWTLVAGTVQAYDGFSACAGDPGARPNHPNVVVLFVFKGHVQREPARIPFGCTLRRTGSGGPERQGGTSDRGYCR